MIVHLLPVENVCTDKWRTNKSLLFLFFFSEGEGIHFQTEHYPSIGKCHCTCIMRDFD